jgi:hypothetical protein
MIENDEFDIDRTYFENNWISCHKTHVPMSSSINTSVKFPEIWDSQEYVV